MKVSYSYGQLPYSDGKSDIYANVGTKSADCKEMNTLTECKHGSVNFTGGPAKTTEFLSSTFRDARELYQRYRASLGDISLHDIRKIADNIAGTTEYSRETVLSAMQKLTQFANMRSIRTIPEELTRHQVADIGNSSFTCWKKYSLITGEKSISNPAAKEAVENDIGLHNTLEYLIEKKGFGTLSKYKKHSRTGIFLDENKLAQLEKFKESDPETFKKYISSPDLKLFYISGWDTGISVADRTKDLETETRKLLEFAKKENVSIEEAIDLPMMKRIKKLGLNPTVIRTEGMATDLCIYRQMTPEKMSENELLNLIDSNSQIRAKCLPIREFEHKEAGIKYLSDYLKVYTPETMSKSIKSLHRKVSKYASLRGFAPENILYVEPKSKKSYSLMNYYYQRVNDIPHGQFVKMNYIMNPNNDLSGKLLVFLDDCTITGDSLLDLSMELGLARSKKLNETPKLFACLSGTKDAESRFRTKGRKNLIIQDYIDCEKTTRKHLSNRKLERTVGCSSFTGGDATCLVFPYMSPDNNTELGANIALLHNTMFRVRNLDKEGKIRHQGIKGFSANVDEVAKLYSKMMGFRPKQTEKTMKTLSKEYPLDWQDRIIEFIEHLFN